VTSHLRLDFNLVEDLTVVDTNDGTNHLRDDDHVTEMGLDSFGLLASRGGLLGGTKLLDETHGLALKTTLESSASTAVNHLHELLYKRVSLEFPFIYLFSMTGKSSWLVFNYLLGGQVQELIKISTTVGKLTESSLSLSSSLVGLSYSSKTRKVNNTVKFFFAIKVEKEKREQRHV
jgi:hypothetical protein